MHDMTTDTLPPHVAEAITAHDRARDEYVSSAESCRSLHANMKRHRQSAAAAANTAADSGELWRSKLRDNDGSLSPEINKIRDSAYRDQELAEELKLIADELNDTLNARQWKANAARTAYLGKRMDAEREYLSYRFKSIIDKMLNSDDGKALLSALDAINDNIYEYASLWEHSHIDGIQKSINEDRYRHSLLATIISTPVLMAMKAPRPNSDKTLAALRDVPPRSTAEGQPGSFSLALRHQRRVNSDKTMRAQGKTARA